MNHKHCFVRAACLAATIALPAGSGWAQEPAVTDAGAAAGSSPPQAFFSAEVGYQVGNHDALTGFMNTFVLGIRIRSANQGWRDYIEVGVSRLDVADTDEQSSGVLVGARSTWSSGRFGLHMLAHFRHGDRAVGDEMETIGSQSAVLGVLGSFDLWRGPAYSFAIGVHGNGSLHDVDDGEQHSLGAAGDVGLSFIAW